MTREDLPPATQAVQAAHAAFEFAIAHPDLVRDWQRVSNTLVLLAVRDEFALGCLYVDAVERGVRTTPFHESDLGGSLTALALEPAARRLVARLPLSLSIVEGGENHE